jgi:hypothetical protein
MLQIFFKTEKLNTRVAYYGKRAYYTAFTYRCGEGFVTASGHVDVSEHADEEAIQEAIISDAKSWLDYQPHLIIINKA